MLAMSGIGVDKFNDWVDSDIIEAFQMVTKRRSPLINRVGVGEEFFPYSPSSPPLARQRSGSCSGLLGKR